MFTLIKIALIAIIIFILGWIPLIGAYDYETALTVALSGLIAIPLLTPKFHQSNQEHPKLNLVKHIGAALLFFLLANGVLLFIANLQNELCDFQKGLTYQLLIALPSNLLAAVLCAWLQNISKFKSLRVILYALCVIADFAAALCALYHLPPLVAFGQFFGYFAGSIYDEAIDVIPALCRYRFGTLLILIGLIAAQRPRLPLPKRFLSPLLGCLLSLSAYAIHAQNGDLPPLSRQPLQTYLWDSVSDSNHRFIIHFIPNDKSRAQQNEQKKRLLRAYDRDFNALQSFFHTAPAQTIDIWLYPDLDAKQKFLGARHTSFARVWKNEIHLVQSSPDSTLPKHELSHLFSATFANTCLKIHGAYNIPAMGWVEGLSMAAEWPLNPFNLHTWSAAILDNPKTFGNINGLQLLYGFWALPSRVAYTLAGSFVHYLIEQFGIERVKSLSQHLPGDFEEIIGISFQDAIQNWKTYVKKYHRHRDAATLAPLVFGASSIWNKHCARACAADDAHFYACLSQPQCPIPNPIPQNNTHSTADKLRTIQRLWALYLTRGALDDAPHRAFALDRYLLPHLSLFAPAFDRANQQRALMTSNDAPGAQRLQILQILSEIPQTELPPAANLLWLERRADMLSHANLNAPAALIYHALLSQTLPLSTARRLQIKYQASKNSHAPEAQALLRWFASPNSDIHELSLSFPTAPILSYLDFINALHANQFSRARLAFSRTLLYLLSANQATQLPPLALRELLRLAPYL